MWKKECKQKDRSCSAHLPFELDERTSAVTRIAISFRNLIPFELVIFLIRAGEIQLDEIYISITNPRTIQLEVFARPSLYAGLCPLRITRQASRAMALQQYQRGFIEPLASEHPGPLLRLLGLNNSTARSLAVSVGPISVRPSPAALGLLSV